MKLNICVITIMGIIVGLSSIGTWITPSKAQVLEVKVAGANLAKHQAISKSVAQKMAPSKPLRLPVYKPPKGIGAPGGRVGGGTRGDDSAMLMLFALVPDHLGLTIQEQPILYWYLSDHASHKLVLTINHEDLVRPVLETTLAEKVTPGIHSVNLMEHHLKLELEKEYRWFVELVVDSEYPARNMVAGGRIMRITPPEPLLAKLRTAEPQEVTAIYSEAGLWYDAFTSISDLIKEHSDSDQYVKGKVSLLRQVDLMEVAEAQDITPTGDSTNLFNKYMDTSLAGALIDSH